MKTISLTKGLAAIVDDEDYEFLQQWKWSALGGDRPYAIRTGKIADGERRGKAILMHREIMKPGIGLQVDHISGDVLDNRRANLRICTPNQNHYNITRGKTNHHKSVRQDASGKWMAYISNGGKQEYLGYFETEGEAAITYNKRAVELFGEFAALNDVSGIEPIRLSFARRNTSGHYGVSYDKARRKWKAKLRDGKKHVHLGRFDDLESAGRAVDTYLDQRSGIATQE